MTDVSLDGRNRFAGYIPLYNLGGDLTEGGGSDLSVQNVFDMGDITIPSGALKQHNVFRFTGTVRNGDNFETAGAKYLAFDMASYNCDAYAIIGAVTLKGGNKEVKALYGRAVNESADGGDIIGLVGGVTCAAGSVTNNAWALQLTIDGASVAASGRAISIGTNEQAKIANYGVFSDPLVGYSTAFIRAWNTGGGEFLKWQSPNVGAGHIDLFTVAKLGHARSIAGTVGAPSWSFVGDTNTGMYSPAADEVAFSGGGTQLLRLKSVGLTGSTALVIGANNNAGVNNVPVSLGAANSGGTGFRMMRVAN